MSGETEMHEGASVNQRSASVQAGSQDRSPPSKLTMAFLRFSSLVFDAVPLGLHDEAARASLSPQELARLQRKHTTTRLLVAVFSMDSLCWGCYKAMEYEALENGRVANQLDPTGFPLSAINLANVNNFVEQTIEFIASAVSPYVFFLVMRKASLTETGPLALFSMKMYCITGFAAVVIGAVFATCMFSGGGTKDGFTIEECANATCACHGSMSCELEDDQIAGWYYESTRDDDGCCVRAQSSAIAESNVTQDVGDVIPFCPGEKSNCRWSPAAICVALLCLRAVFYSFGNQLGDSTVEIGRTQWLGIFDETELRFPGCLGRHCFRRPSSAKNLSTYLMIFKLVLLGLMNVIYTQVKKSSTLSWLLVLVPGTFAAVICLNLTLARRSSILGGFADLQKPSRPSMPHRAAPDDVSPPPEQPENTPSGASDVVVSVSGLSDVESSALGSGAELEVAAEAQVEAPLLRPWQLRVDERHMVLLLIIAKTASDQMNSATLALFMNDDFEDSIADSLDGNSDSSIAKYCIQAVTYVIIAAGILYLLYMIYSLKPESDADAVRPAAAPDAPADGQRCDDRAQSSGWFARLKARHGAMALWLLCLWAMLVIYSLCGVFLYITPSGVWTGVLTVLAMLLYLSAQAPYRTLIVSMETFPLLYDVARAGSLIYWHNVGSIVVSFVLAGTKLGLTRLPAVRDQWDSGSGPLECESGSIAQERVELGVNIFVTAGLLFVTALYYSLVDPHRPVNSSVGRLVRRVFERRNARETQAL